MQINSVQRWSLLILLADMAYAILNIMVMV